jgi:hypothetical protein
MYSFLFLTLAFILRALEVIVFGLVFIQCLAKQYCFKAIEEFAESSSRGRTSHDLPYTSHDLTHMSHDLTHTSHDLPYTSHDLPYTSHDLTHTSHDLTHMSHDLTHMSHDLTHTSHDLTHTSHDLTQVRINHTFCYIRSYIIYPLDSTNSKKKK